MAGNSAIEWTEATWNPIVGCSIVSPGCTNCYAMKMAARLDAANEAAAYADKHTPAPHYAGTVKKVKGKAVWTGKLAMAPDSILLAPLKRKKPTVYFVNSMGDLFHEDCPDEWIDKVFAVGAFCPQHTLQILTKRSARMRRYFADMRARGEAIAEAALQLGIWHDPDYQGAEVMAMEREGKPLPNVWLGVSTERQQEADERIPELLKTPAAVRFISAEPLLGPIDLEDIVTKGDGYEDHRSALECDVAIEDDEVYGGAVLDWVITGGESGAEARPSHPDWFRQIRDACDRAGVAYFHKQNGEWAPGECAHKIPTRTEHTATWFDERWIFDSISPSASEEMHRDDAPDVYRLGKKAAGRMLDGKLHDAMPEITR